MIETGCVCVCVCVCERERERERERDKYLFMTISSFWYACCASAVDVSINLWDSSYYKHNQEVMACVSYIISQKNKTLFFL